MTEKHTNIYSTSVVLAPTYRQGIIEAMNRIMTALDNYEIGRLDKSKGRLVVSLEYITDEKKGVK